MKKSSAFENFFNGYFIREKRKSKDSILFRKINSFIENCLDITKLITTNLKIQIMKKKSLTGDDVYSYIKKLQKILKD